MNIRHYTISGHIVDALRKEQYDGTLVIEDGRIKEIIRQAVPEDAPFILPGFIDSHIHIESTLLIPEKYAGLAVTKGVVAIVSDPHEIANVTGLEGVNFMIDNGRKVRFHFNFGASPCVPCTPFETAGAELDAKDMEALLERDDIYGMAEFMNAVGVVYKDPVCMAKLEAARKAGKPVDGHAPGLSGDFLKQYAEAGISTDHECVSIEEGRERLQLGMYLQIREGSASSDFETLSPLLSESEDHLMFCSDDKYPNELMEGYIDKMVRDSVRKGHPLWNILNAACVTPVKHYGLKHGLLQSGDSADFITVDNLQDFNVTGTYIDGMQVFDGSLIKENFIADPEPTTTWPNKFAASSICAEDLKVIPSGKELKVITAQDLSLRTGVELAAPRIKDGAVAADPDSDILKLVVYNRYSESKPQVAFIKGFQLECGAMASTIAHDSHNIVAIGTDDGEIVKVINRLVELKGGIVISDGRQTKEIALPIAGLMSPVDGEEMAKQYAELKAQAQEQGCPFNAPFMTMAFMALPVIPDIKLTDKGLFDAVAFQFTPLMQ